jgi:hypothetical protein
MGRDLQYIQNPDVVLREEGEEGAILFNTDTDQLVLVNPVGLFIWKLCNGRRSLDEIAAYVRNAFEDVPEGGVVDHVKEFITGMMESGFVGISGK